MSMNPTEQFRQALEAAGLSPAEIIGDGQLHRCPTASKPQGKDGAYILHLNGHVSGWWQNWSTGETSTWTAEGQKELTPQERKTFLERMEQDRKARQEAQAQRYREAATKAEGLLKGFRQASKNNQYLKSKGVQTVAGLRTTDTGDLVVPIRDTSGKVQSLQFIHSNGNKRFLTGGQKAGGFFKIKGLGPRTHIVEGLATGLSVHEATQTTVLCAFDAGNLKAVAESTRKEYPNREIIIAGDNDTKTEGNPGMTKAREAAQAINGKWVVPLFQDRPDLSDFNDLHQLTGIDAVSQRLTQASVASMPGVPRGFLLKKDGVYFLEEDKDGVPTSVKVCSPLYVIAQTRDSENEAWGRLLQFTDPEGRTHQWSMPMAMLSGRGDEYRKELLHKGLCIEPGTKAQNRLSSYLSSSNPQSYARCVPRVGWHNGQFVLPDEVYGSAQNEQVILQTEYQRNPFTIQGTLQEWKDNLASICVGNSRLAFALSLALAAPLLEITGQESGGIHFVGGSSTGKTTVLRLAGTTAGGGGINGFIEQWRATDNGLESTAALHCDCPLLLDEVGQASGKVAGEVAYMLANGQGKTRASRSGGSRPSLQWRILFLSTGEITLSDKIKEDKFARAMAGQTVRMVDIPIDAGKGLGAFEELHGSPDGDSFARRIKEVAGKFYGTALREFVKQVAKAPSDVARRVNAGIKAFIAEYCPPGSDGQIQRVAARFALAACTAEEAISYGILPWPEGEGFRAASACFSAWLRERGGIGSAELQEGFSLVRSFIQQHGASRFENLNADHEQRIINRAGYRRIVNGETQYCIPPEMFRKEVCPGHNPKPILGELKSHGLLIAEARRNTLTVRTPDGKQKLHVISSRILEETTGGNGDSEDMPEITGKNLPPSGHEQQGTTGTNSPSAPTCPHSQNAEWGQKNSNDSKAVPVAPGAPTDNSDKTCPTLNTQAAYKHGSVTI